MSRELICVWLSIEGAGSWKTMRAECPPFRIQSGLRTQEEGRQSREEVQGNRGRQGNQEA